MTVVANDDPVERRGERRRLARPFGDSVARNRGRFDLLGGRILSGVGIVAKPIELDALLRAGKEPSDARGDRWRGIVGVPGRRGNGRGTSLFHTTSSARTIHRSDQQKNASEQAGQHASSPAAASGDRWRGRLAIPLRGIAGAPVSAVVGRGTGSFHTIGDSDPESGGRRLCGTTHCCASTRSADGRGTVLFLTSVTPAKTAFRGQVDGAGAHHEARPRATNVTAFDSIQTRAPSSELPDQPFEIAFVQQARLDTHHGREGTIGAGIEVEPPFVHRPGLDPVPERWQPHVRGGVAQGFDPRQPPLLSDDPGRFQRAGMPATRSR